MSDIKQKTKIGMLWNSFEKIFIQGISFVIGIILARLLSPHDYGVIGMLSIFLTFSNVFIDSGFTRALIQRQERTEEDFSTILLFNIIVSCGIYGILFLSAPYISEFYKTPELVLLERVFFITLIINALGVVQNAKFQINVDFKKIAIINSLATIISGFVGILFAYNGYGPWALVYQNLTRSFISTLFYWILGKWKPKTGFSKKSFKNLFSFGSKLLVSGILSATQTSITDLVIGKIYKPENLGYYTRAQQFPTLISGTLTSVLNTSTFPLLATLQNKKDDLISVFNKLIKISTLLVFPSMIGLSIMSDSIIIVLFGEKWASVSELLFWLALPYIFVPYSVLNMNLLNAIGRSDLFLKIDLIKIPLDIVLMIITFPISLKAVVIGKAACSIIYYIINTYLSHKLYDFGPIKQLLVAWKYILSTLIMAICILFVKSLFSNHLLNLTIGFACGAIVYILMLIILKDEEFFALINKILRKKTANKEMA